MAEAVKKLVRPQQGRVLGGVAIGMAHYFNIDVSLARILWALTLLPGGIPGLVLYVICWAVIPEASEA